MSDKTPQLDNAMQHDTEALDHLTKAIESEAAAVKTNVPADRERYGEIARKQRKAALESLEMARTASERVKEL